MSDYLIDIARDSLADFETRVAEEESAAAVFTGNRIASLDGQPVNLAAFRRVPAAELPGPPRFAEIDARGTQAAPLWTGVVVIGLRTLAVSMARPGTGEAS